MHNQNTTSVNPVDIANLFSKQFSGVFSAPITIDNSILDNIHDCLDINNFKISLTELFDALTVLKINSASGPDSLPSILLNKCRYALAKPIHHLFSLSLNSGIFPEVWKVSYVTPIWKSGL